MLLRRIVAVVFVLTVGCCVANEAAAQTRRPFDDYTPSPTVSPYMNLINNSNANSNTATGLFLNYELMVKPQLDQRNYNRQSAAAIRQIQQQQAMAAKSSAGGDGKKLRSTGHVATRVNYSHFYPGLTRQ